MQKIWEEVKGHVKGRAVRGADGWTVETPGIEDWTSLMQFKQNKKIVDTSKTEHEWKQWLVKMKDKPVYLVIYEYGSIIGRQQELDDFTAACIRPLHTDRSGATAEASLRDVVANLRTQWGATFQADQVHYIFQFVAVHIFAAMLRSLDLSRKWTDRVKDALFRPSTALEHTPHVEILESSKRFDHKR
ncbi:hypothetical protein DYB26_000069 [Aphanomyces astaci]|uniref:Uncharacterized protein n=2 Tax=Aphanomyces astaci TaxID=112090 RepID=A0A3R6XSE0_APHAT|nr:hypothetical protein DYB26_000069 [Aphanomyces astaci]